MEIDDTGKVIDEYRSNEDGVRLKQAGQILSPILRKTGSSGPVKIGQSATAVAISILDADGVGNQDLDSLRNDLVGRVAVGAGMQMSLAQVSAVYKVCVSGYIEAVKVVLGVQRRNLERGETSAQIESMPKDEVRRIQRDFLDYDSPCFFPECEELRAQRLLKLENAGGQSCRRCDRTTINNEFASKAVTAILTGTRRPDTKENSKGQKNDEDSIT